VPFCDLGGQTVSSDYVFRTIRRFVLLFQTILHYVLTNYLAHNSTYSVPDLNKQIEEVNFSPTGRVLASFDRRRQHKRKTCTAVGNANDRISKYLMVVIRF
jgi:hypothetical protein